jgi:hypothetical protein
MAYFNDLEECNYFGPEHAHTLRSIGWLANDQRFTTGATPAHAFAVLKELLVNPWQPAVVSGIHECELCQYDRPAGCNNLFVPNGATIFVCPELIAHYIAVHRYRPPDKFLSALMACPNTRSLEYKKRFLASGGRALISKPRQ